jgi:hypothetical protein
LQRHARACRQGYDDGDIADVIAYKTSLAFDRRQVEDDLILICTAPMTRWAIVLRNPVPTPSLLLLLRGGRHIGSAAVRLCTQ